MSPGKEQGVERIMDELRDFIEAKRLASEAGRRKSGCLDIATLCRKAEHPETIAPGLQRHILSCKSCRRLYEAILEGYPRLPRPSWGNLADAHDTEKGSPGTRDS